jgi:hypothetical protein
MKTRVEDRNSKIARQCAVLADVINAVRHRYETADDGQRSLIETMIGAAIWYIPKPPNAWSGLISLGALRLFLPDSGSVKPRFSEEHIYPRKVAAQQLLADTSLNHDRMTTEFVSKYGKLHYITPQENKAVQKYQRSAIFSTPDEAYSQANVVLIHVKREDLKMIKKRDSNVINNYLKSGA